MNARSLPLQSMLYSTKSLFGYLQKIDRLKHIIRYYLRPFAYKSRRVYDLRVFCPNSGDTLGLIPPIIAHSGTVPGSEMY